MKDLSLSPLDIGIIIVYIVGIIIYGLKKAKRKDSEEYFLAGRNMTWPIVGISLFAANIGSSTLIGLASDAFKTNVAVYNYEWMAAVVLVFFAVFFLPFYLKSRVYTMPEFLERRYDSRSRYYFSFITVVGNVIIDTAAGLYAGNLILKLIFPEVNSTVIIIVLALAAAAYTIPGGLSSVVHTEVIQAMILVVGSTILTYYAFSAVGGWSGLMNGLHAQIDAGKLHTTTKEIFSLVKSSKDPLMPWTGLVFGVPLLGFYFWANNQFMVQRVLSAKNLNHGRWGALFAGLLKLPVIFIMVLPGVIAIVLYSKMDISSLHYYTVNDATGARMLCTNLSQCPNLTYPVLIYSLLPKGVLGLVIAGLLAAMSSSVSATLNSASTLITMDFVHKMKPGLTSKQLVRVGQIATVILVVIAALWAPQIDRFGSLFQYLQMVLGLIAPPVVAVFLLGLFWKRGNANGAFVSLITGLVIAIFVFLSEMYGWSDTINNIHFLNKAPLLLVICMAVHVGVSLATAKPSVDKVENMTWSTKIFREETIELKGLPWYKNYRYLSIILLLLTAAIVFWFR
ncbi:sodium/glucose cotransporter 2 [Prolixibacter bellariivorans]|uniref:Sodium/glucose cotransporter 2 n=1 Tax=Prolixibacter bellariivorans TaxID=314319 RepID=A0A5M4B4X7_9BACT|nr:sodium:solute symporter [Prolixibacter bellariivorans]GET34898.1 sodium/glucose cotransporter 2 [Prolixibacter bellariivorans]